MAFVSSKFSLLTVPATKRPVENEPTTARAVKVPRASEVVTVASQSKITNQRPRLPIDAPVEVCIYQYCDHASLIWDLLEGNDEFKLYQVQITHDAQRSLCFDMKNSFNAFLAKSHQDNAAIPPNLQQLEKDAAVKLVVTDRNDPDGVGFINWRVVFTIAHLYYDPWFRNNFTYFQA